MASDDFFTIALLPLLVTLATVLVCAGLGVVFRLCASASQRCIPAPPCEGVQWPLVREVELMHRLGITAEDMQRSEEDFQTILKEEEVA